MLRRIGRLVFKLIPLWSGRVFLYAGLVALVLVGGLILGLRYWLLPNAEHYRGHLEAALTRATGQRITIGTLSAEWQGLRPQVSLGAIAVHDGSGKRTLDLARIDSELSWLSLLFLEPRFHTLSIQSPALAVRRGADGTLSIANIELAHTETGGGISDWILRQREIVIRQASIVWIDAMRGAPPLNLEQVTLRLYSDLHRHRFGLRATAPEHLAGLLDLRADLTGRSVQRLGEWEGQLYAQLDYADLAAWKPWVDLPIDVERGRGALRLWVDVGQQRITGVIADVELAGLRARLGPELAPLDLAAVSGRLGWRVLPQGYEVSANQLGATGAQGLNIVPFDLTLRRFYAHAGKPERGELKASALDLEAIARVAEHLPIDAAIHAELERYAPRGGVSNLSTKWSGAWPPEHFEVKARFSAFGWKAAGQIPGVANVAGQIDANEKRGAVVLAARGASVDLPKVFPDTLAFDEFAGQVNWTAQGDKYDIRLSEVRFANADLAGTLQGSYQPVATKPGFVDLTASLARAEARRLAPYLPLRLGESTREWLQSSVLAGQASDVRLRLKGDLADFPFHARGKGVFEVTAKATGGTVDYADGWPRVENINATLAFTGARMEIRSSGASILGVQLPRTVAVIADLLQVNELLEVSGEAEGPTAEFLRFIAQSPVAGMIERFTDGKEAQGRGRLGLKLALPLRALKDARVSGNYQFLANRLRVDPDLPPLEQVNGRIDFTESTVRGQGIVAQLFGGPASINVATEAGAVDVTASGRVQADVLRKALEGPIWQALTGSAEWRGTVRVRAKLADIVIESNLQGLASSLPAPLAKAAGEVLPLRVERRVAGPDQDQVQIALGSIVAANMTRRRDGAQMVIERAAIGLNSAAPVADAPGLRVRGTLGQLDADRWRALLAKSPGGGLPSAQVAVDVKIGILTLFDRRFNEVTLDGQGEAQGWKARASARELAGEVEWRAQGKGALVARMQRLALPTAPATAQIPASVAEGRPVDYPVLDLVVEEFHNKGRALGRVELLAVPAGREWRIERLRVRNADANLAADGHWYVQGPATQTQLNLRLETVDSGKLLARLGYPEGVRGAAATVTGTLSWAGAPQDMDFATLSGKLQLETGRGQFAKLEPGIGKLLSILSLQALPRRVALDFKDVFSEGFSFDTISATVGVQRGVASTDSFNINGSSAKVAMSGEVDLMQETQKLRVRVTPAVGNSVATVTTLLGGPVVGIGVYLAQKLLNDPLGQLIAYDYAVTGTWTDPTVTRVVIDRASEPG